MPKLDSYYSLELTANDCSVIINNWVSHVLDVGKLGISTSDFEQ